ncbi:CURVATURE THYLAKOID chloroplastic-like isoform B [Chlorella sorokiniana]|uniref:CURVATURE THYLAKOID chloroplastic-like isoform B n=1 Tax=Chlorella sorokiniana TaxID=3076 RepID=A0A2P6TZZ9_CHLSO|nr:CURVATURE THYLAKOID chloroplastic-like isoform B [Chlorella sorokiniana]|eukprot:PRW59626.1 CURVATURE THYLAKOID chloroplastic-like isoform B [Chlorella sorokiniana]
MHEDRLIELVEQLTSAGQPEGKWLTQLELVEQGERLVVQETQQAGTCGEACRTVERAAEQIMGEHDTDVAEALFVGKKSRAQFSNWLCYELSSACKHKPPPLPKARMQTAIACSARLAPTAARVQQRKSLNGARLVQQQPAIRAQRRFVVKAESTSTEGSQVDVEALVKDVQEKWDKVENKTSVIVYGAGGIVVLWLAATIVGALNNIPLLPKIFELVGLGYSAWFTYRYLLFKSSREELVEDIESLKKKISS